MLLSREVPITRPRLGSLDPLCSRAGQSGGLRLRRLYVIMRHHHRICPMIPPRGSIMNQNRMCYADRIQGSLGSPLHSGGMFLLWSG